MRRAELGFMNQGPVIIGDVGASVAIFMLWKDGYGTGVSVVDFLGGISHLAISSVGVGKSSVTDLSG